jgi:hypothetical protein
MNSITAYNDEMIAYLDEQIKEAKQTLNETRTSKDRLSGLERTRKEYEQQIRILEKEMWAGQTRKPLNERDIEVLVRKLYSLKNWGKNLKDIKTAAENYGSSPYHERLFRAPRNFYSHQTHHHHHHSKSVSRGFQGSIAYRPNSSSRDEGPYKQSYSRPSSSYCQSNSGYGQSNGGPYSQSNGESHDSPPAYTAVTQQPYTSLIPPEDDFQSQGMGSYNPRSSMVPRSAASEQNVREVEPQTISRKLKTKFFKFK